MNRTGVDEAAIEAALAPHGLIPRGGFHPAPRDAVPGAPATLVLVGNAGPAMWSAFRIARRDEPGPLDAWCRRVLDGVARDLGARALFPFDGPPWLPFPTWAMKADTVYPSPIGPLIHPVFGLWHAYRGALAFDAPVPLPAPPTAPNPCRSCADRPCLAACPVEALTEGAYDVPVCASHVASPDGAACLNRGCAARRACPVGRDFVYDPEQARHHMAAFVGGNAP